MFWPALASKFSFCGFLRLYYNWSDSFLALEAIEFLFGSSNLGSAGMPSSSSTLKSLYNSPLSYGYLNLLVMPANKGSFSSSFFRRLFR